MRNRRNNAASCLAVDRSVLVVHLTTEDRNTLDAASRVLAVPPEEVMRRGLNLLAAAGEAIFGNLTVHLSSTR